MHFRNALKQTQIIWRTVLLLLINSFLCVEKVKILFARITSLFLEDFRGRYSNVWGTSFDNFPKDSS